MVLDPAVYQLEVIPDFAILIVPTVRLLQQDGDVCPPRSTDRISALLELLHTLVQEVVVLRTDVYIYTLGKRLTQVLGVVLVSDNVVTQIYRLPIFNSFWIDFTRNLVPRLQRVVVVALHTKDGIPDIPLIKQA